VNRVRSTLGETDHGGIRDSSFTDVVVHAGKILSTPYLKG